MSGGPGSMNRRVICSVHEDRADDIGNELHRAWTMATHLLIDTGNRGRCYRLLATLICGTMLAGCVQSIEDSNSRPEAANPLHLLPASTRGAMQLRNPADTAPWFLDEIVDPWRHKPTDIIRHYLSHSSASTDDGAGVERLILGQTLAAEDGFILIARFADAPPTGPGHSNAVATAGETAASYQGYSLQPLAQTALFETWIDDKTLAIGPRRNLELVIGVHTGQAANIHKSAIASHLEVLDTPNPVSFVYGLPGLYRAVRAPGSGASSLSQADVAMAEFGYESGAINGSARLVSDNAETFAERLLGLLPEISQPDIMASANSLTIKLDGLSAGTDIQALLKTLFIEMDAVDYNEAVTEGGNQPWLYFNVGDAPNSVFINFEFRNQALIREFELEHLPRGFTLAPVRIIDTESPRYFLVVNLYPSSGGLVEGARAEWSVFVNDPGSSEPRFLVIQAAAENISADSVRLLTLPEPVSHVLERGAINSYVGVVEPATGEEALYFNSRIDWPQSPESRVAFDREFVAANDYIYWGNAVADRGLYNASVYNRDAVRVAPGDVTLLDNSRWAQYVNAAPVHTLVYLNPLDFVISPWWNLDATYLDATDAYRQTLVGFKNNFYPRTVLSQAEAAVAGDGAALLPASMAESVPESHYHFLLTDPEALLASVGLAGALTPVPVRLYDDEPDNFYLSLAIYGLDGDPCGLRAEWQTYVSNPEGRPETLLLQALSSEACLDPDNWLGLPAKVQQEVAGSRLTMRLASPFFTIDAELELERSRPVKPGRDWLEAGDRVCSPGQVCNRLFYEGQSLQGAVQRIEPGDIVITALKTPWDDFFQGDPVAVTVRKSDRIFAANPWHNVPGLGSPGE